MDELTYSRALAQEVILSKNQNLMDLLAWCDNINIAITACKDNPRDRAAHSAVITSTLLMEVGFIEETGRNIIPILGVSIFNKNDIDLIRFSFIADFEKKEIVIRADIVDVFGGVGQRYSFIPHTVPMRDSKNVEDI